MPQQLLLRHIARRLRPGTLAGFWQGRYTLQPWNQVANSAYSQQPAPQGQTWDTGSQPWDFGFAAHAHITNPSTGLDSIYQKHVWSRLSAVESPEGSDADDNAQAKALAAATAFATLQPAAAAAAQEPEKPSHGKPEGFAFTAALQATAAPAPIDGGDPSTAAALHPGAPEATPAVLSLGISAVPEVPEQAPSTASAAAAAVESGAEAAPASDDSAGSSLCTVNTVPSTDTAQTRELPTEPRKRQADELPSSAIIIQALPATQAPAVQQSALCTSVGDSLQDPSHESTAGPPNAQAARQLAPLAVLTGVGSHGQMGSFGQVGKLGGKTPKELLRSAMHAPQPSLSQQKAPLKEEGNQQAAQVSGQELGSASTQSRNSAAPVPEQGEQRGAWKTKTSVSSQVQAVSASHTQEAGHPACLTGQPGRAGSPVPGAILQLRAGTAAGLVSAQAHTAVPMRRLKRRRPAESVPAVHALHISTPSVRPALAAAHLLLDQGSVHVKGYMPGLMIANGDVCGRSVHACYLDLDILPPLSQQTACSRLSSMIDTAVLAGTPIVTIYNACSSGSSVAAVPDSSASAADLTAWMPAVQRHMDASGVVPQLGIAIGRLRPVSSLLISASDYTFSTPMCARYHQDALDSSYSLKQHCGSSSYADSCTGESSGCSCEICQRSMRDMSRQGSTSHVCASAEDALHRARQLLVMLPSTNGTPAPQVPCHDPPWRPCRGLQSVGPLDLCIRIADAGQIAGSWAGAGTAVCFGRLDCSTVGLVAMPCRAVIPGACSHTALAQVIRMVRFCSAFSLPIVSVLLPHKKPPTEPCTNVRDLANLVFAYGEAVVPKVAVLCGPEALAAEKCLKSDVALMWTSGTAESSSSSLEQSPARSEWQCESAVSIKPEDTRAALCSALRPLLGGRLVTTPKRKHALLPAVSCN